MSEDLIRQADEYNNAGVNFFSAGLYNEALEYFVKAAELYPDAPYYDNIGRTYINLKDYDKAIKYLNKCIELVPTFADVYVRRGFAFENLEQYDEAISDYKKAIALNPNDAVAINQLSNVQRTVRRNTEGTAEYYNAQARICEDNKDYARAIEYFTKAIELYTDIGDKASDYTNRGLMYANLRKYKEANQDVDKAVELQPENAEIRLCQGTLRLASNDENFVNSILVACLLVKKQGGDVYSFLMNNMHANMTTIENVYTTYKGLLDIHEEGMSIDEIIATFKDKTQTNSDNQSYMEHSTSRKLDL